MTKCMKSSSQSIHVPAREARFLQEQDVVLGGDISDYLGRVVMEGEHVS